MQFLVSCVAVTTTFLSLAIYNDKIQQKRGLNIAQSLIVMNVRDDMDDFCCKMQCTSPVRIQLRNDINRLDDDLRELTRHTYTVPDHEWDALLQRFTQETGQQVRIPTLD